MTEFMLTALRQAHWPKFDRVWLTILLIVAGISLLDPDGVTDRLTFAASALLSTLPYVVFACLLIGGLAATGAQGVIAKAFEGRETRMIFAAALFGGLAPFCSCEVIPFAAALLAAGAPLAAVMAFWLSSPVIDPPTLLITAAALGWPFAIAKAMAAVGIGIAGGFAMQAMARTGAFANPLRPRTAGGCCGCGPSPFGEKPVWRFWQEAERHRTFRLEAIQNLLFLVKWMSLAYLLEAMMVAYVPAEFIAGVVGGDGVMAVVIGALAGTPAYLNGYPAPALVAGLIEQGMSVGAGMAFILSGAMTCIPAMAAVWALVKPQVFGAYLSFAFIGSILVGLIFAASGFGVVSGCMRVVLLLIAAVPALMGFRTLGLFRDWIHIRRWARYGLVPPVLSETLPPDIGPEAAEVEARRKLIASALSTASACCFAVAGGAVVLEVMG